MGKGTRIVFLDRDGTLNVDHGYISDPGLIQLLPEVKTSLLALRRSGFAIVVVTNQSGIGRGLCSLADVAKCNQRLIELLAPDAVPDLILLCPHDPTDGCACRKPQTGMLQDPTFAARFSDFDQKLSWMVGDKVADVEFGINAGLPREHCVLLAQDRAQAPLQAPTCVSLAVNLAAAVQLILR